MQQKFFDRFKDDEIELNPVLLPTLFNVVNNVDQYESAVHKCTNYTLLKTGCNNVEGNY